MTVTPPAPAPAPNLPTWTDPHAVTSYLVSIVGVVFGAIGGTHPGFAEPSWVQAALPIAGLVIAAAAQVVNMVTHRSSHTTVAQAQAIQTLHVAPTPPPTPPSAQSVATALAHAQTALDTARAASAAPSALDHAQTALDTAKQAVAAAAGNT